VICSFFTLVAPSHRDEAGQVAPPDENAGEQILPDDPDHLESLFAVDLTERGNDQVVVVLKNPIAKGYSMSPESGPGFGAETCAKSRS
jgi:hypothetical protein